MLILIVVVAESIAVWSATMGHLSVPCGVRCCSTVMSLDCHQLLVLFHMSPYRLVILEAEPTKGPKAEFVTEGGILPTGLLSSLTRMCPACRIRAPRSVEMLDLLRRNLHNVSAFTMLLHIPLKKQHFALCRVGCQARTCSRAGTIGNWYLLI